MARPISKVAPGWWDYTTLDRAILDEAARLDADDLLQLARPGFARKAVFRVGPACGCPNCRWKCGWVRRRCA